MDPQKLSDKELDKLLEKYKRHPEIPNYSRKAAAIALRYCRVSAEGWGDRIDEVIAKEYVAEWITEWKWNVEKE